YYIHNIPDDEAGCRRVFEFGRKIGIETFMSEPAPEALDTIEKFADAYDINVAIHNHPKDSPYWNPGMVLAAVKDRSRRLGACADTGHWVRSGLDPLACLKQLEGRIVSLHLKDLSWKGPNAYDVPWGTGVSRAPAMLAELKRQKFSGVVAIEYENNNPELMSNVARCVAYFKACAPLSAQDLLLSKALVPGMTREPADVWKQMKPADDGKWSAK
ncbi:MAG: sugar phosphate isomerase/epimerase, partial [Kiritimatiellaeota bacterium]|nr:sugar phosphate isomerase/epimerase [Kiritimatiellota bacterium]